MWCGHGGADDVVGSEVIRDAGCCCGVFVVCSYGGGQFRRSGVLGCGRCGGRGGHHAVGLLPMSVGK